MSGDLLLHLPQGFMKRDIFATKRLLYKTFIFDRFEDFLFKCNIVTPPHFSAAVQTFVISPALSPPEIVTAVRVIRHSVSRHQSSSENSF